MQIEIKLNTFLAHYLFARPTLLLGLSGGPDSTALFHLLLAAKYPFEVAHINHNWRQESDYESEVLQKNCQEHGILCHVCKLTLPKEIKNLEDTGRKARLSFFKKILISRHLEGVLLAHHADDHAETVLKRIFEGATLSKIKGLLPKACIDGMQLYRPLLSIHKKEIIKWLEDKKINYFVDLTNNDNRFLRSRMRNDILPSLSKSFGKEVSSNLCKLGESAGELEDFLDEAIKPYLSQIQYNLDDISIDFSQNAPTHTFIWKCVIRKFFNLQKITLPRTLVDSILCHFQRGASNKTLMVGSKKILIQHNRLTIKEKNIQ